MRPDLKLISIGEIKAEEVKWLWYPYLPRGKLTIVLGNPGEGKTTFVLAVIAAVVVTGREETAVLRGAAKFRDSLVACLRQEAYREERCAVLGPALYFLINPGLLAQRMGGLPQEVVVAMLGQLIWAVALACAVWLLLGALHRRSLNTSSLLHGMQIGLCLLDGAFVVSVFGVGLLDLRGQIAAVRQANTMLDNTAFGTLNSTALFLVCGWLVQSLPALLNLGIVHGLLQLVKLAKADRFAPGMAQAAAHCGTLAGGAAAVDVTVQAVFLAVQLCAAGQLHQLNSGLHIALLPVLFAVAALLFSRWLAEGCALREENEGFI